MHIIVYDDLLFFVVFMAFWSLFVDVLPIYLKSKWQGSPWKTPRAMRDGGVKRERQYYKELLQRLEMTREDPTQRSTYYIDKFTKQRWVAYYVEKGSDVVTPIDD